jgi:hypothetical protein
MELAESAGEDIGEDIPNATQGVTEPIQTLFKFVGFPFFYLSF